MRARRPVFSCLFACLMAVGLGAQKAPAGGPKSIEPTELKEWLSYIASDELQGRQIYTEGLGLAAAYISDHLAEWGVKPAGEDGTYFQTVKVVGVRTTSNASVTVEVNGQKRTFKDGEGITFPRNMGGKQIVSGDQIQFVGYGLQVPTANIDDYANLDSKGKVIVYIGAGSEGAPHWIRTAPRCAFAQRRREGSDCGHRPSRSLWVWRKRQGRRAPPQAAPAAPGAADAGARGAQNAPAAQGAAGAQNAPGAQGAAGAQPARGAQPAAGGRGFGQPDNGDFTTVQRYDQPVTPSLTAQDEFFEFLFSGSDMKYETLKDLVDQAGAASAVRAQGRQADDQR